MTYRITVYDRYARLWKAMVERYRVRIYKADPRVTLDGAFQLAHNWGNQAARDLLDRYQAQSSALLRRRSREYLRAEEEEAEAQP